MKVSLLILGMMITCFTFGQTYHRVLKENRSWDIAKKSGSYYYWYGTTFRYFIDSDTLINGKNFNKLRFQNFGEQDTLGNLLPPFYIDTATVIDNEYFLREDTVNKQIYLWRSSLNREFLINDFSLNVGDTLVCNYIVPEFDSILIVEKIDTIVLQTGEERRRFFVVGDSSNSRFQYIEGIGSVQGFIYQFSSTTGGWTELLSVKESMNPIYGNECDFNYLSLNNFYKLDDICIYPNPFKNRLQIKSDKQINRIIINSISGQVIIEKNLNKTKEIDLSKIDNGIYIIKFYNKENELMEIRKIVKDCL